MKISKWLVVVICAGATLLGFVVAEAQQVGPSTRLQGGVQGTRVQAGAYPADQSYNPGVQAQPGRQVQAGGAYGGRTTVQRAGGQWQGQPGSLDVDIAAHLALGNAEEIAMSRLGQERAESDEVHEFAQMMIKEHSDFLNRLNRVQPEVVATYGRLSGARTASFDEEGYDRRTTRRVGAHEEFDGRSGGSRRSDDDFRGSQRGSSRGGGEEAGEADFRSERGRIGSADRTGTDRTGTQRTGSGRIGNSSDQPTGGDEDAGTTGTNNNQTGTAGPSGTGAGSTGGVGTRTGEGRAPTSGSSGANTGGASGTGTGTSGTSGGTSGSRGSSGAGVNSGNAGGAGSPGTGTSGSGTGAGSSGSGAGTGGAGAGGAGAGGAGSGAGGGAGGAGGSGGAGGGAGGSGGGAGGSGGGAGGSGGSGASILPAVKTYPVVFQAGSADENEDQDVPNRRRSGDVEEEGTTIGRNQTEPRGGYNQESTTQDNAGSRSSRGGASRADRSYDEDDYRDTRRGTSATRSTRAYDDEAGYDRGRSQPSRYADDYDARRSTTTRTPRSSSMQATAMRMPHLQLQQAVTERCLANAQRELEDKEGSEFDMAFMGMQIVAHNRMLAMLEASRDQASPQLARLIDEGIDTTQQHLDHAREIVENLRRDQSRTSSRERSRRE